MGAYQCWCRSLFVGTMAQSSVAATAHGPTEAVFVRNDEHLQRRDGQRAAVPLVGAGGAVEDKPSVALDAAVMVAKHVHRQVSGRT